MLQHIFRTESAVTTAVWIAAIAITAYYSLRCIYNLYFHPLCKFPGPKLAAIGSFLDFYYDVVKDGTYLWEIEKMHRKYGKEEVFLPVFLLRHPPPFNLVRLTITKRANRPGQRPGIAHL